MVPLRLFKDRNFSLANVAIITVGGAVTSMTIPLMLYLQSVLGLSPMGAAVLASPMAVLSGVLAPFVGRLVDRVHPRYIAGPGLFLLSSSMAWVGLALRPDISLWELLVPIALMGVASACVWSPLSVSATRNLTMDVAGAGAGVYNTTRQVGAVLGSAMLAAAMEARLQAHGVSSEAGHTAGTVVQQLPEPLRDGFSRAMGEALLLPAAALVIGVVAALFFARPAHMGGPRRPPGADASRVVTQVPSRKI